jgi:hypothetical protein
MSPLELSSRGRQEIPVHSLCQSPRPVCSGYHKRSWRGKRHGGWSHNPVNFGAPCARALPAGNACRCIAATLLALFITLGSHWPAAAQPELAGVFPAQPVAGNLQDPPDPMATMAAYQAVDRWIRQWGIDDDARLPAARAASIILRLDGEVIARGIDVSHRSEGDASVTALAARAALREAESRLAIPRDALYEDSLRDVARRITISLELSGPFEPFAPKEWADATRELEPGIEGVAVRLGNRTAAIFPATMLATATEPASAYSALISRLSEDPTLSLNAPAELARDHGIALYRFAASHIAQPRASTAPEFLHRGGMVVQQRDITAAELQRWADAMADHLLSRADFGSYSPVSGESEAGSEFGRAISIMALVQYSELDLPVERFLQVRRGAAEIASGVSGSLSPAESAPLWVALRGMGIEGSPQSVAAFTSDGERLRILLGKAEEGLSQAQPKDRVLRALVTWARARRAVVRQYRDQTIESEIRALYRETPAGELVSVMPWLGWAELAWSRFETTPGQRGPVPAAAALRDMRAMLWQHQLTATDLSLERRDLVGAIVFTRSAPSPPQGATMPTWHTARPLAFCATALGDPRLTEDHEIPSELGRVLASLRFLRQLTAGQAEAHMYRHPAAAIGGVRASLWDQRMPPEATALTLIAVTETLRSLQAIEARQAAEAAP